MTNSSRKFMLEKNELDFLREKSRLDEIKIEYLSNLVFHMNKDLAEIRSQARAILSSSRWQAASLVFALAERLRFRPLLEKSLRLFHKVIHKPYASISPIRATDLPPSYQIPPIYDLYPYNSIKLLRDIQVQVVDQTFDPKKIKIHFSIATPVWNEEDSILNFLESVKQQTLLPDEIILTDGASTDNTVSLIEQFAKSAPFRVTVIREKRVPISTGRNRAIQKARNEIIVMADAGTLLDPNYCLNLVGCFQYCGNPDLVGGIWLPIQSSEYTAAFIPDWNTVPWNSWLTSTRAMAFKKSVAKRVGYFPEHVFYGDDTLFCVKMRSVSKKWVFNKKALTLWDAPFTKAQFEKTSFNYGKGDGENGLGEFFYHSNLTYSEKASLSIQISPVRKEFLNGYLAGRKNRGNIERELRKIKGVAVVLTKTPFYENQRSAVSKKIQSLIQDNWKVIAVHFFSDFMPSPQKKYLNLDYTLLELYEGNTFDVGEFFERYPVKKNKIVVFKEGKHEKFDALLNRMRTKRTKLTQVKTI